ncbi:hypothetical protein [Bacillus sp. EB600]|uniref:hypothetical protein n=1 Tax=Bacillus sp. EB600 TaxID=2806345 RepID=UPI00210A47B9|nr:hypothetical protein [Bacillus sp. EB600]MCQ6282535.1 hypothetical protein [Bacillus sp. EB600]
MEDITNQNMKNKDTNTDQEAIMNRVNQTFEQIVQDVKNMLDENSQEKNDQLS